MANFQTHKNIGISSSVFISLSLFFVSKQIEINELLKNKYFTVDNEINLLTLLLMVLFGYIGSLFPDIDLKTSKPLKIFKQILYFVIFFIIIYFFSSFELVLNNLGITHDFIENSLSIYFYYSIVLFLVLIIPFLSSNFIFFMINKLTHHRGIVHSIPFMFLISLLLYLSLNSQFLENVFKDTIGIEDIPYNSFFIAVLFFIGGIVHFLLDEFYSVDFKNNRIKKSSMTAFTFISFKKNSFQKYIVLYFLIFLIILFEFLKISSVLSFNKAYF